MTKESFDKLSYKPIRLSPGNDLKMAFKKIHKSIQRVKIADQYESMLEELFLLRNPKYRFDKDYCLEYTRFRKKHFKNKGPGSVGQWFYYPWLNTAIHVLPELLHQELRTGRNKNLITNEEQNKFYQARVVILGMSVGSHVALTIIMTGGAKFIKLADPDTVSGSNLNRIRAGTQHIGVSKVVVGARQIYEINPYAKVEIFSEGASEQNLKQILLKGGKADIIIEETDNPYLKLRTRELARSLSIPVIMAADNDNGIIVDVERYDLNKNYPILHGFIDENMTSADFKTILPKDLPRIIAKMAGAQLSTERMLNSVNEVGKSLYSWPQLGNAAALCGSVLAFLARKIILKSPIKSGRINFSPDEIFIPPNKQEINRRQKLLKKIGVI